MSIINIYYIHDLYLYNSYLGVLFIYFLFK